MPRQAQILKMKSPKKLETYFHFLKVQFHLALMCVRSMGMRVGLGRLGRWLRLKQRDMEANIDGWGREKEGGGHF